MRLNWIRGDSSVSAVENERLSKYPVSDDGMTLIQTHVGIREEKREKDQCIVVDSFVSYLVDPASSHMLVSKIKPCMSKFKRK